MSTLPLSLVAYASIGTLGLVYVTWHYHAREITRLRHALARARRKARKIRQWPTVEARLHEVGINIPYFHPDIRPKGYTEAQKNPEAMALLLQEQIQRTKARGKRAKCHDIVINASYQWRSEVCTGGALAPFLSSHDRAFVYRLRPNQMVRLHVNPRQPEEAYLLPISAYFVQATHQRISHVQTRLYVSLAIIGTASVFGFLSFMNEAPV